MNARAALAMILLFLGGCATEVRSPGTPAASPAASAAASAKDSPSMQPGAGPASNVAFSRDGELVIRDLGTSEDRVLGAAELSTAIAFTLDSASLLVVEPIDAYRGTLMRYPVDGSSPSVLREVFLGSVARSPDQRYVVFGSDGAAPNGLILADLATGEARELTSDGGHSPVWSPDSTRIAYEAFDQATQATDLYIADAATSEVRRLTDDPAFDSPLRWTEDGRAVIVSTNRGTDNTKTSVTTWTVDAETGALAHAPTANRPMPISVRSPDGRWDAVLSDAGFLEFRPADGSFSRHVVAESTGSFSWSPSGEWLVVTKYDGGQSDLYLVRVPDGEPVNLTHTPNASEAQPVWGPSYGG